MMSSQVVIAVATFRRVAGLGLLIDSLQAAIARVPEVSVKVIVVDNDPDESARTRCLAEQALSLEYIAQPVPGISETRNAAIAAALDSEFIVFVDDDEVVAASWLAELLRVQREHDADLVAGPVYSVLPEGTPSYIKESGIFDREQRPDGSTMMEAGSGNLLSRASTFAVLDPSEWFQSEFSLSGGGDAELTRRLHRTGARIVWAAHAAAWEPVPEQRLTLGWLMRRYRRVGATDYRLQPPRALRRVRGLVTGFARIVLGAPPLIWAWAFGRGLNARAFRRVFRGVGYVEAVLGRSYLEYGRGPSV